jgi:predicted RNA-binding Zn-ribbon protein involved in translation (DUF1610 family)
MKCTSCGGTEINAHNKSLYVYRVVREETDKVVLNRNPKHIYEDNITFFCAACGEIIDDNSSEAKNIIYNRGT